MNTPYNLEDWLTAMYPQGEMGLFVCLCSQLHRQLKRIKMV
jgi:hypothetical protein